MKKYHAIDRILPIKKKKNKYLFIFIISLILFLILISLNKGVEKEVIKENLNTYNIDICTLDNVECEYETEKYERNKI